MARRHSRKSTHRKFRWLSDLLERLDDLFSALLSPLAKLGRSFGKAAESLEDAASDLTDRTRSKRPTPRRKRFPRLAIFMERVTDGVRQVIGAVGQPIQKALTAAARWSPLVPVVDAIGRWMGRMIHHYWKPRYIALAAVALLAAGVGAWKGRGRYQAFKEHRFARQTVEQFESGQFDKAMLAARKTLLLNPANLAATRVMTVLGEKFNSPLRIVWLQRLAELEPTVSNRLALARASLAAEPPPFPSAVRVLRAAEAEGADDPNFQALQGVLALKLGRTTEAEQAMEKAVSLAPTNRTYRINLATLRLRSPNPELVREARQELEKVAAGPEATREVFRSLIAVELAGQRFDAAIARSEKLLSRLDAETTDRLQHLGLLRLAGRPESVDALKEMQRSAQADVATAGELVRWMTGEGMAEQAIAWLAEVPQTTRNHPAFRLAIAECLARQQNWDGLDAFLLEQPWGEREFLRLGFQAFTRRQRHDPAGFTQHWERATERAAEGRFPLAVLIDYTRRWGWFDEATRLLHTLVTKFPGRDWELQSLYDIYAAQGNTPALHRLYESLLESRPSDTAIRNNYASISLVLGRDIPKASAIAGDLHRNHPTNVIFAATYAFALQQQGQVTNALAVMEGLPPDILHQPDMALYHALILADLGQTNRARDAIARAEKARLLPEERRLLTNVVARVIPPPGNK